MRLGGRWSLRKCNQSIVSLQVTPPCFSPRIFCCLCPTHLAADLSYTTLSILVTLPSCTSCTPLDRSLCFSFFFSYPITLLSLILIPLHPPILTICTPRWLRAFLKHHLHTWLPPLTRFKIHCSGPFFFLLSLCLPLIIIIMIASSSLFSLNRSLQPIMRREQFIHSNRGICPVLPPTPRVLLGRSTQSRDSSVPRTPR